MNKIVLYKREIANCHYNQKQNLLTKNTTMKTAFTLAALALAANARELFPDFPDFPDTDSLFDDDFDIEPVVSCFFKEMDLDRWSFSAEMRIPRMERSLARKIESYARKFNCDGSNPDRVKDITADELAMFMMGVVDDAIANGDFEASDLWGYRDENIGDCDLEDALMEYQELRDDARELDECLKYLSCRDGVVAADVSAYFSCTNPVFATTEWCVPAIDD